MQWDSIQGQVIIVYGPVDAETAMHQLETNALFKRFIATDDNRACDH